MSKLRLAPLAPLADSDLRELAGLLSVLGVADPALFSSPGSDYAS